MFFAELLDVYSYYVFDTPTLFACLVNSVDEELRCFFIVVCDDRCEAFDASAYPRAEFKSDVLGGKKAEWCLTLLANVHLSLLLGFDGSETVHPPHFSSRGLGCGFFFSDSVCCSSHL